MPDFTPYNRALLAARARRGQLDRATLLALRRILQRWTDRLAATVAGMTPGTPAFRTRLVLTELGRDLDRELAALVSGARRLSFERTLELWERAGALVAESAGVPLASLGAVRTPAFTLFGAYDAAGSAATWRTLLRAHTASAVRDVANVMALAFAEGVGPEELSRRLRRYVAGSEPFRKLFEEVPTEAGTAVKLDLRRLPFADREAARRMRQNADRIAVTELHQARGEAELQHFLRDPWVKAVQRQLSPDRGSAVIPDACDYHAGEDMYGLGPGTYPIDRAPPIALHPYDRCEYMPVTRSTRDAFRAGRVAPKPSPASFTDPATWRVEGADSLSETARARIEADARRALELGRDSFARLRQRRAA